MLVAFPSCQHIDKMSMKKIHALRDTKLSVDHKKKISEGVKRQWAEGRGRSGMGGKKHSEKSKEKMRKWHTGKILSQKTKKKIREACKGEKAYNWKGGYENQLHLNKQRRFLRKTAKGTYSLQEWKKLKAKHNYTCLMCGKTEPDVKLTIDHIIPLTKNGTNYISNIQPLCRSCNSKKGAKILSLMGS